MNAILSRNANIKANAATNVHQCALDVNRLCGKTSDELPRVWRKLFTSQVASVDLVWLTTPTTKARTPQICTMLESGLPP